MDKLSLKETQGCLLDLLEMVDHILSKYDLRYSLAYGTLIGAARHKGFIPWDDDVDIVMPWSDYLKLLKIPEFNDVSSKYQFHYISNDKKYNYPFVKFENNETKCVFNHTWDKGGAFLDIFPITPIPNEARKPYVNKLDRLNHSLGFINSKSDNKLKNIIHAVVRPMKGFYRDKLINEAFKYIHNDDLEFCDNYIWTSNRTLTRAMPKNWFNHDNFTSLSFEGHKFKVISHYAEWLTKVYGSWESLPPEADRIAKHDFDIYVK